VCQLRSGSVRWANCIDGQDIEPVAVTRSQKTEALWAKQEEEMENSNKIVKAIVIILCIPALYCSLLPESFVKEEITFLALAMILTSVSLG
jgi:hypothetical protein